MVIARSRVVLIVAGTVAVLLLVIGHGLAPWRRSKNAVHEHYHDHDQTVDHGHDHREVHPHGAADHRTEVAAPKSSHALERPLRTAHGDDTHGEVTPFFIGRTEKNVPWMPEHAHARKGRIPHSEAGTWRIFRDQSPRILYLENMATPQEQKALIDAASPEIQRSQVISHTFHGKEETHQVRTSSGMFMASTQQRQHPVNVALRQRLSALIGIEEDWIEATQILKYQPGQFYRAHNDYFDTNDKFNMNRGGQRIATAVVWLNDVEEGGETSFPLAGITAKPKGGDAVIFYDVHPDGSEDPYSNHGGDPPKKGFKWIAVFWCHPRTFH